MCMEIEDNVYIREWEKAMRVATTLIKKRTILMPKFGIADRYLFCFYPFLFPIFLALQRRRETKVILIIPFFLH